MILRKENLKLINTSQKIAIVSFILGSAIFLLFYQTEIMIFTLVGFLFLLLAIPLNTIFLLRLVYEVFTSDRHKKELLITISMLLINIPIAYVYYIMAFEIANRIFAPD